MSRTVPTDPTDTWIRNAARLDEAEPLLRMPLEFCEFMFTHTHLPKDYMKFAIDSVDGAIRRLDEQLESASGDYFFLSMNSSD